MTVPSDFDRYHKREKRRQKLEELVTAIKDALIAMSGPDKSQQYTYLGKVYAILDELDKNPPLPPGAA